MGTFYGYEVGIVLFEFSFLIIHSFFLSVKTWLILKWKLQLAIMCFSDNSGLDDFYHCGKEGNKSLFVPHSLNEQNVIEFLLCTYSIVRGWSKDSLIINSVP